jgi:uncharacterized repeat protein (TIGR02543 family)
MQPRSFLALVTGLLLALPITGAQAADRGARFPGAAATRIGPLPFVDVPEPVDPTGPGSASAMAPGTDAAALAPPVRQVAAAITSIASGNWSSTSTWSSGTVPTSADDVTIADGHTVTINAAAACNRLTVGQGTSGTLRYDNAPARTLTVSGDVTVAPGGTFESAPSGSVTTHGLVVGGNLTNDGTLDFSTNGNTAGAVITFTGAGIATFGGAGATTDIRTMVVNKGTSSASRLELDPANFTVRGAAVNAAQANGMLTLTNGTFKLAGTFAGSNTLSTVAGWTIPASAGLWLANPNYTVAAMNGTITLAGKLTLDAGTFDVGNSSGNRLAYAAGSSVVVNGGTLNIAGRFSPATNPCTYTQTGGTVNITTVDNSSTTNAGFDLQSGSTFNMSGGTIALQKPSSSFSGPRDYRNSATTVNITGGTLQVGNASSGPAATYYIWGAVPDFTISTTSGNHSASLIGDVFAYGTTTIPANTTLIMFGKSWVVVGPSFTNDGTIDGSFAGSTLYFRGTSPQTYGGAGIAGTTAGPFTALTLDNPTTVTLSASSPPIVASRGNLFRGTLVNSGQLQLGVGGASTGATQIGVAGNTSTGGNYDAPPAFAFGTGGYFLHYEGETAARTTGIEIPPARAIAFLNVANTHDVTLAGGDLAISGTLQLAANGKNLTTGANTVAIGTGGTVLRVNSTTSGWVVGNLRKAVPAGNSTPTFEVGDAAAYTPVALNLAGVAAPGTLSGRTDAGDVTLPAGSGLDLAKSVNRNWTLTGSPGLSPASATGTFTFVPGDVDGGATPGNFAVRKLDGGTWSPTTTGTRTATSTQATWTSGFSTFAVGELARYAVNVATAGSGAVAKNPDQALYDDGSSVQLTATPAPGWHFVAWSGDASGATNPLTVVVDGEKNVTATFAPNSYALNVTTVGSGAIAKNPDQASYDHGASIELTATPDVHWHFAGWSGDATGAANPLTVVMDADKNITGTFALDTYALDVNTVGSGSVARNPDQALYEHGSSVELTAVPAVGWHFTGWSGDATGTDNPVTVLMDGAKNVTATFAINTYTLDVATVGSGAVAKAPDQALYDHGTSVELTATAIPGWHFAGWSGDASGTTNPLTVVMDASKSITATFAINTWPVNVAIVGSGTVAKDPDAAEYVEGTSVELTATPAVGWHFVGWTGDATGTTNPLTVVMDAGKNITATFAIDTHSLDVTTIGSGTVTKNPDQAEYDYGTSVELTATAAPGWHFTGWSGDATGSDNPVTVVVDGDKAVTATFAINTYALDVATIGSGAVAKDPDQALYDHGTSVVLTATPAEHWHFVGWSGDATGTTNPLTVVMDAAKSITATFAIDTYALDVAIVGSGSVAKNPDLAGYDHGSSVELTATPAAGWHFVGWSGDATGTDNPVTVVMDGAKSVTATFAINTYALNVATVGSGAVARNPDQALYDHGTAVELTATAIPGWHFVGWSGDASGADNPLTIVMDAGKNVTATFAINTWALNVAVVGSGTVVKNPDAAEYVEGSSVELTATPAVGWHFVGWTGDASGAANPLTVVVDAEKNVTATFAINTYAVNVATVGSGTVARNPDQAAYDHGTSVELTATAAPGWHFVSWSGDATGAANPTTILVDGDKSVSATFAINTYALDVATVGSGSVAKDPDQAAYDHGTSVVVTATPDAGWHFVSWSGDASGTANPVTVVMDGAKAVTANFAINTYALNVTTVGSGAVAKNPDQAQYDHGSSVELTATPAAHWHFVGWSGDASGSDNPLTIVVDAEKNIVATFALDTYALDVTTIGDGAVAKNPDLAAYDHGSSVQLTATAAEGWEFVSWGGDASGSTNPLTVAMNGPRSITATFATSAYALDIVTVGNGSVTRSPDQATYLKGSSVEIAATPQAGWHFVGWSGDFISASNPATVLLDADKNITATFAINTYAVNVATVGSGAVAKNPDLAAYDHGSSVELTATPAANWHFVGWSGDASGAANPLTVLVEAEKNLTATFAIDTHALAVATVGSGTVAKNPDQETYDHGASVELTATPAVGWHFVGWSGDATGSDNPLTVVMDADRNITATFEINTYALDVTVVGSGAVAKDPDQPAYDHGTSVELTATPAAGWHFVGWGGDASGATNPLTVVVDAARNITATFAINTYALVVTTVGSGAVAKNPDQLAYDHGTSVELTATPAANWHFVGWSDDATGATNPLTVVMDSEKDITATFALDTHALAVTTVGSGTVAKNPDQAAYDHGAPVELTATPATGWHFTGWSGDASGSDNPVTVVMDGDRSVTATFEINTYALDVATVGSGGVTKNPDQALYDHGTSVELAATADPTWHFVGWSGDATGSANPLTVEMDAAKSITATFALDAYALDVTIVGSGAVARNPDQAAYDHGSSVELTATPATGWHFVGWGGAASGSANPLTVVMDGPRAITATFEIDTYALDVTTVGSGAVAKNPDQALYDYGTSVELTATPAPNWHFVAWSGDASGSANPLTVILDAPKAITATFALDAYALDVSIVGSGAVVKNPDQAAYDHGSSVELTATPDPGWLFAGWSGDAGGVGNPLTVVMDGAKSVVATFISDLPLVHVDAPNTSGEVMVVGQFQDIRWTATDNVEVTTVDLYLSRNGAGGPFEPIALGIANTGTFEWSITGPATETGVLRVVAHDALANEGSDDSDEPLQIVDATVAVEPAIVEFALLPVVPSPSRSVARLRFDLPKDAQVDLGVVDVRGREVASLVHGAMPAGRHTVTWNGQTRSGRAAPGVYFARYAAGGKRFVRRIILTP